MNSKPCCVGTQLRRSQIFHLRFGLGGDLETWAAYYRCHPPLVLHLSGELAFPMGGYPLTLLWSPPELQTEVRSTRMREIRRRGS